MGGTSFTTVSTNTLMELGLANRFKSRIYQPQKNSFGCLTTEALLPSPNKTMSTPIYIRVERTFCSWTVTCLTVQAINSGTFRPIADLLIHLRSIGIQPHEEAPSPND
jgi:hypothetical protein